MGHSFSVIGSYRSGYRALPSGGSCRHPRYRVLRNGGRDSMRPVELAVLHVVSLPLELRHDAAAALVDGKNLVARPVRDEHARAGVGVDGEYEPWRECDDPLEQVAVGEA